MSSAETPEDYTTWTPEQLMRDYHGELKGDLFIRVAEWYTNPEVEAKINSGRSDGSKIKQPNFYAEFKRNVDNAAIGEGHLPAEYRLRFDKRRLANLEARFGPEHGSVRQIRTSVRQREAVGFPTIPANPTLQELEAARPDHGKQLQKGRETKDYYFKFVAATKKHSAEQIGEVYNMAKSTMRQEINRAKRVVESLLDVEKIERSGQIVEQQYVPPPLLQPGQKIYTNLRPRLIVVLKLNRKQSPKKRLGRPKKSLETSSPSTASRSLLSTRIKTTLSRLRNELDEDPTFPSNLAILARRFALPIDHPDATAAELASFASCETSETLAGYAAWCDNKGAEISRQNSAARISKCLSQIICLWRDEVREAEEAGAGELPETFLEVVMRRLEDIESVEGEVELKEMLYDEWAMKVECE